jgi:D-serine deaminase-like pyridoxal phosphate-dependent protein
MGVMMMKMMTTGWVAAFAIAGTLQAVPAQAQDKAARAAELEQEASTFAENVDTLGRAASLYRKAAGLRLEGDPQGIRDLLKSGALAFYVGDASQAASDLEKAGEVALVYGDVKTAARAFLDAAWAAEASDQDRKAYGLAMKAHRLAQSPLLEDEERFTLLARIDRGVGTQ